MFDSVWARLYLRSPIPLGSLGGPLSFHPLTKAGPVAAKRKKKTSFKSWFVVAVAVAILVVAAISLLSDRRLSIPSADSDAATTSRNVVPVDQPYNHDREQIDQESREELRKLLRDDGSAE